VINAQWSIVEQTRLLNASFPREKQRKIYEPPYLSLKSKVSLIMSPHSC
jgi:hypothetical protein